MKTNTRELILAYLVEHKQASPHELQRYLGIGAPALFRQLKTLLAEGEIAKAGQPPKVFYFLREAKPVRQHIVLDSAIEQALRENFFFISPLGEIEEGSSGFTTWCENHNLPVAKTAQEYVQTLAKYTQFKKNGLIDGMEKLVSTFPKVYLDQVFYLDFYSIERFGKTKLGSLLLYAKQSQSRGLMHQLFSLIQPSIHRLIAEKNIGAVGFVPPTIQRTLQFQKELERNLHLNLPTLKIVKAGGTVPVAQKTLNKLDDRIKNAKSTIFIEAVPAVKTVLLIDDAVGSGASLNETARKIKEKQPNVQVIGLAITGSFKGFDVLNEV